tara:strand:- start:688 stop:825 length:138 start_codon:yes stop_codon:yes gene_type:complete
LLPPPAQQRCDPPGRREQPLPPHDPHLGREGEEEEEEEEEEEVHM